MKKLLNNFIFRGLILCFLIIIVYNVFNEFILSWFDENPKSSSVTALVSLLTAILAVSAALHVHKSTRKILKDQQNILDKQSQILEKQVHSQIEQHKFHVIDLNYPYLEIRDISKGEKLKFQIRNVSRQAAHDVEVIIDDVSFNNSIYKNNQELPPNLFEGQDFEIELISLIPQKKPKKIEIKYRTPMPNVIPLYRTFRIGLD